MRAHAEYEIVCECGRTITSYERVTTCEHCHRLILIEWQSEPAEEEPEKKKAVAA